MLVTYGDGLSNLDNNDLADFRCSHGKIATITGVSIAARFGELKVDGNKVQSFSEKPDKIDEFLNGGFFVFDRAIFYCLTEIVILKSARWKMWRKPASC